MASSGEIALPLPLCRRSFHSYESYLGIWNIDGRVEGANNKYFSTIRVVTKRVVRVAESFLEAFLSLLSLRGKRNELNEIIEGEEILGQLFKRVSS